MGCLSTGASSINGSADGVASWTVTVQRCCVWLNSNRDRPLIELTCHAKLHLHNLRYAICRERSGRLPRYFLGYYVACTTYLVLAATVPAISRTFGIVMLGFVIPLTATTLVLAAVRSMDTRKPEQ